MIVDTRDARRVISATSRLGLGYLASLYDDTDAWKEDDEDGTKGLVFTEDLEKLKRYNAQDCVETARVWAGIRADREWGTERVQSLYRVQTSLAGIAARMHTRGVCVDPERQRTLAQELELEAAAARDTAKSVARLPADVSPNPNVLRSLLYRRYQRAGVPCFALPEPQDRGSWSEKGEIKVDKKALSLVLIDPTTPPEAKAVIKAFQASARPKMWRTTFVDGPGIMQAIGADGRLRAGWNTCGTATGRWSISEPNLQNVPPKLRSMYVADPGYVFVRKDKSQLEVRVMAAVSGDQVLEADLNSGDLYTAMAKAFFKLPAHFTKNDIKPRARKAAKAVHLGSQYGAGDQTVWQVCLPQLDDISFKETVLQRILWKKRYAGIVDYWARELALVKEQGYSETRVSRRRRIYWKEPENTETSNYPIQGTASDMMNLETIELEAALAVHFPRAYLAFQLHDALFVCCPEEDAPGVEALMHNIMTRPYMLEGREWTFPSETKIGKRWDEVA